MEKCDICGEPATIEVMGGPVMTKASLFGMDRPFPRNSVFRCEKHENSRAFFGKPWAWKRLSGQKGSERE